MTLQRTIGSYLYWQYADDEDLQAFISSFNDQSQSFLDWFNNLNLPIYTDGMIAGPLLDWVADGLYGMKRPALPLEQIQEIGPFNTYTFNSMPFGVLDKETTSGFDPTYYAVSDDVFKRILTWHFYKGDGKVFTIDWLKRRVMRFLFGENGSDPPVSSTIPISVTFSGTNTVNINLQDSSAAITAGAFFNGFGFNQLVVPFNDLKITVTPGIQMPLGPTLQAAINSGALEFPFQFQAVVNT